jgi:hypothetical protein
MQRDLDQLLGAVNLGFEVGFRAGADVAIHAGHVGVGGNLVGGVLRMHHVAGLAAELRRIHVRRAAVAGHGDNQQVEDGSHQNDVHAVAEDPVVEIDLGKFQWNMPGLLQHLAPMEDADGDHHQPGDEKGRQDQEEDNSQIRVVVGRAKDIHQPVANHGDAGGGGDGASSQTDGVIAEEQRRPDPAFTEFL